MKKTLFFSLVLLAALPAFSQFKALVELNKNSSLSILVETNMMNFSLVQKGDKLMNAPVVLSANVQNKTLYVDRNKMDIDVKGFKSENLIAQSEFYKLMKVEKFPHMKIELVRFDLGTDKTSTLSCGTALLNITITNVTRKYEFPVAIDKSNGMMRVAGKKKLSITDFGLSAPHHLLLGMVKVNDRIEIDLDFQCSLHVMNEDIADLPVK